MTEPMRIVGIRVRNFKKIKDIELENIDRNIIIIGGNNGEGKSSFIDAVKTALDGLREAPAEPIRRGASKATIDIDLGDLRISETFTKSGSRLELSDKDGKEIKSPANTLAALRGKFLLDPVDFITKKSTEQAEMLRALIGLDFSDLETKKKALLESKLKAEFEAKSQNQRLIGVPLQPDAPAQAIDEAAIEAKFGTAKTAQAELEAARNEHGKALREKENQESLITGIDGTITESKREAERFDREITDLMARLKAAEDGKKLAEVSVASAARRKNGAIEKLADLAVTVDEKFEAVEKACAAIPDTSEIAAELKAAREANAKLARNQERARIEADIKTANRAVEKIKGDLDAIVDERRSRLAAAPFPINGLGFDEETGGVTFNAIPFAQASQAEKLKVAVGISLAGKSRIRFVPIKDGSLLDEKSLEMIREMVIAADAQVWIERVGKGQEVSIIIEDGELEAAS